MFKWLRRAEGTHKNAESCEAPSLPNYSRSKKYNSTKTDTKNENEKDTRLWLPNKKPERQREASTSRSCTVHNIKERMSNLVQWRSLEKSNRQEVESLRMSLMFPPKVHSLSSTLPNISKDTPGSMAPIHELEEGVKSREKRPESDKLSDTEKTSDNDSLSYTEKLSDNSLDGEKISESEILHGPIQPRKWLEAVRKSSQAGLKWFIESPKVYHRGIYLTYATMSPSGRALNPLEEYNPFTKNEGMRTNLVIALTMLAIVIGANFGVLHWPKYSIFFETPGGMVTFFLIVAGAMAMHYAMFLVPRLNKPPVNFVAVLVNSVLASCITMFITGKFQTYILINVLLMMFITGSLLVFLATARFDFRRYYLLFLVNVTSFVAGLLLSGMSFLLKWFDSGLHVMWLLILGHAISSMLGLEIILMAQRRTLLLTDDDYCLGGYMLFLSSCDITLRIVQVLMGPDVY